MLLFAASLGFLWLGTVPLTSGLVGYMFGPTHMAMLWGIVFFSHQLGSFFGGWGAGRLYDVQGQLRRDVVDLGRPRRSGRPASLADSRKAGAASRDGAGSGMTERGGRGRAAGLASGNLRRREARLPGPAPPPPSRLLWFAGLAAIVLAAAAFVLWTRHGAGILLDMMLVFCALRQTVAADGRL